MKKFMKCFQCWGMKKNEQVLDRSNFQFYLGFEPKVSIKQFALQI